MEVVSIPEASAASDRGIASPHLPECRRCFPTCRLLDMSASGTHSAPRATASRLASRFAWGRRTKTTVNTKVPEILAYLDSKTAATSRLRLPFGTQKRVELPCARHEPKILLLD